MKWCLYILLCDNKIYYTGYTKDLGERLETHITKKSKYTKQFADIELVYTEEYETASQAKKREKQLKGWSAAKKKALINNNKKLLINLSKSTEVVEDSEFG